MNIRFATAIELDTKRLKLREWRAADVPAFAQINADPRVMEFYPQCLERTESDALIQRIQEHFQLYGFGLWAVEVPGIADFIGFVGLAVPTFDAHFTPCVEIGWRLAFEHWGHGYATEAARKVIAYGFETGGLSQIVSFTTRTNLRSRAVMERLEMHYSPADDFDNPNLDGGHPQRPHVLYRLNKRVGGSLSS